MTVANEPLAQGLAEVSTPRRKVPVWAWLLVAFALVSVRAGDHRQQRARLRGHPARGDRGVHPDRAGRSRRPVVRAGRRGQHRPRGHDDPRHDRGGLLRLLLRSLAGRRRRDGVRRHRRCAARAGHGDLRRRPHRVRRRDQHHGRRRRGVPRGPVVLRAAGRRPDPVPAGRGPGVPGPARRGGLGQDRRGQALVHGLRPRLGARRADPRPVLADGRRGAAHRGDVLHPLAHGLRAAAALLRREPERRGDPRRERLPLQDHRGAGLRCHRRPGRRLHRAGRRRALPERHHQRPRLHRPRGDDLRQLATGRTDARRAAVRLHRRPAAAGRRRGRARAADRDRDRAARLRHLPAAQGVPAAPAS